MRRHPHVEGPKELLDDLQKQVEERKRHKLEDEIRDQEELLQHYRHSATSSEEMPDDLRRLIAKKENELSMKKRLLESIKGEQQHQLPFRPPPVKKEEDVPFYARGSKGIPESGGRVGLFSATTSGIPMEAMSMKQQQQETEKLPGETERQRRLRIRRMERTKQKEEREKKMEELQELQELYRRSRKPEDSSEKIFQNDGGMHAMTSESRDDVMTEPVNLREKIYEEKRQRRLQKTMEDVPPAEKKYIHVEPPRARVAQVSDGDLGRPREAVKEDLFGGADQKSAFGASGRGGESAGEIRSKRDEVYMRKKMERLKAREGHTDPKGIDQDDFFGGYKPTTANPFSSDTKRVTPRHSGEESHVRFDTQLKDHERKDKGKEEGAKEGEEWAFYRTVDGGEKTRIERQEEYKKGVQEFEDRRHRDTIARVREETGFSVYPQLEPPRLQKPTYTVGALPTTSSIQSRDMGKSEEEKKEEYRRQLEEQIKKRTEKRRLEREQSLRESIASGGIVPGLGETRGARPAIPSPRRMDMPPTRSPNGIYGPYSSSSDPARAPRQPPVPSSTSALDQWDGHSRVGRRFEPTSSPPAISGGGTFMGGLHAEGDDEIKARKKQEYAEELRKQMEDQRRRKEEERQRRKEVFDPPPQSSPYSRRHRHSSDEPPAPPVEQPYPVGSYPPSDRRSEYDSGLSGPRPPHRDDPSTEAYEDPYRHVREPSGPYEMGTSGVHGGPRPSTIAIPSVAESPRSGMGSGRFSSRRHPNDTSIAEEERQKEAAQRQRRELKAALDAQMAERERQKKQREQEEIEFERKKKKELEELAEAYRRELEMEERKKTEAERKQNEMENVAEGVSQPVEKEGTGKMSKKRTQFRLSPEDGEVVRTDSYFPSTSPRTDETDRVQMKEDLFGGGDARSSGSGRLKDRGKEMDEEASDVEFSRHSMKQRSMDIASSPEDGLSRMDSRDEVREGRQHVASSRVSGSSQMPMSRGESFPMYHPQPHPPDGMGGLPFPPHGRFPEPSGESQPTQYGYPMFYAPMQYGGPGGPMMMPYMMPPSFNPGSDEIKKLSDEVMLIKLTLEKERLEKERMEREMKQKEEKISKLERHLSGKGRVEVEDEVFFPKSSISPEPMDGVPPIKHSLGVPFMSGKDDLDHSVHWGRSEVFDSAVLVSRQRTTGERSRTIEELPTMDPRASILMKSMSSNSKFIFPEDPQDGVRSSRKDSIQKSSEFLQPMEEPAGSSSSVRSSRLKSPVTRTSKESSFKTEAIDEQGDTIGDDVFSKAPVERLDSRPTTAELQSKPPLPPSATHAPALDKKSSGLGPMPLPMRPAHVRRRSRRGMRGRVRPGSSDSVASTAMTNESPRPSPIERPHSIESTEPGIMYDLRPSSRERVQTPLLPSSSSTMSDLDEILRKNQKRLDQLTEQGGRMDGTDTDDTDGSRPSTGRIMKELAARPRSKSDRPITPDLAGGIEMIRIRKDDERPSSSSSASTFDVGQQSPKRRKRWEESSRIDHSLIAHTEFVSRPDTASTFLSGIDPDAELLSDEEESRVDVGVDDDAGDGDDESSRAVFRSGDSFLSSHQPFSDRYDPDESLIVETGEMRHESDVVDYEE